MGSNTRQIDLGDDFGDVTVTVNGACVKIYGDGRVLTSRAANDTAADPRPGELVPGKGVYLGAREIKDRDGERVGEYDLYAAPEDLKKGGLIEKKPLLMTFNQAVQRVAELQDYHGYGGFNHNVSGRTPDEALYDALREWGHI